jgi:hypothetical protein
MNTLNVIGYSYNYSEVLDVLFAVIPDAPLIPNYVSRSGGDSEIGLLAHITIGW